MVPKFDPWTNARFGFPRKDAPAFQREWMPLSSSGVLVTNIGIGEQTIIKDPSAVGRAAQGGKGAIKITGLPAEEDNITITDAGGDTSGFWFTNLHTTGDAKSEGNMWVASATTVTANVDNLVIAIAIATAANLDTTAAEPTTVGELPASQEHHQNSLTDWVILTQGTTGTAGNTTITPTGNNFNIYNFGTDGLQEGAGIGHDTGTIYLWGLSYVAATDTAQALTIKDADDKEILTAVATQNGPYFLQLSTPIKITDNSGLKVVGLNSDADSYITPLYTVTRVNYE